MNSKFEYIIVIKPLGLMYASMGAFLSPQNLVGRSNNKFPPDSPTLSGIYAAHYKNEPDQLQSLQLAGSFWSYMDQEQDFYVPTPFNCLVKDGEIKAMLTLHGGSWRLPNGKVPEKEKYHKYSWLKLSNWKYLNNLSGNSPTNSQNKPIKVKADPWINLPHLHPRLETSQRIVVQNEESQQGSLFLENAVQLPPDVCLIYLANIPLPQGWYRFGGEGHMVEIDSYKLSEDTKKLLEQPIGNSFALISPGVWGTNRLSHLSPVVLEQQPGQADVTKPVWNVTARISDRPRPFRYRLGKKQPDAADNIPKLLSRGRYAVPAGSVYVLEEDLPCWYDWGKGDEKWFPEEGYSFKRWGCSLALPLSVVVEK